MVGVDASSVTTEMVNLHSLRYRTDMMLVGPAMCQVRGTTLACGHMGIPIRSRPQPFKMPTPRGELLEIVEEPLLSTPKKQLDWVEILLSVVPHPLIMLVTQPTSLDRS
jgi:hypothetical protein